MPGDNEQVNYSYTGDVSSLKKATKDALGLLDQYQAEISRLSSLDAFGRNAKASSSFQSAMKSTSKVVDKLQKQLQTVSDIKTPSFTGNVQGSLTGLTDVAKVYDTLKNSTSLTTKEVKGLTAQLKNAQASIKSNGADVEALVGKEVKFQATLNNLKSKSEQFKSSLDNVKNSVSTTFNPLLSKLNTLTNPFARVVSSIQTFKSKTTESFGRIRQMADAVSSAFRRVQQSEDGAANSADGSKSKHDGLEKELSDVANKVDKETEELNKESQTLKSKDKQVSKSTSGHKKFTTVINAVGSAIKKELSGLKNLGKNFKSLVSSITGSNNAFSKLKNLVTSLGLVEAANQSIKYAENLNLFNVAMGSAADKGHEFVNQMQEIYGMDPSNIMRYAGNFYQLADAIKMPDDAASNLSLGLTKATNDIASLFNVDVETVFENLSSGMQGMTRAVRKYGMDIRTVTLQQTALSYGITEEVESMSEANRQALRFITMMDQAKNATRQLVETVDGSTTEMGDFANTIEQPANQLRILKEQISQFGRSVGDLFIKPLSKAIQYINGFVMALRTAITFIGSLIGATKSLGSSTSSLGDTADGVDAIGNAASEAAKEIKSMTAPFDELNTLQESSSNSGNSGGSSEVLDPALQQAIADMSFGLEDIQMKANKVRDSILSFLGFKVDGGEIISWDASTLETNLINKFPQWTQTIQATFSNWGSIVEGFKAVLESVGVVADTVGSKVANFIGKFINDDTVSEFINNLSGSLQNLATFVNNNADSIANFFIALPGLLVGIKVAGSVFNIINAVTQAFGGLTTSSSALVSSLGRVALWVGVVVAAIVLLYNNSSSFAESFNALMDSLWAGFQPILANIVSLFTTVWESLQMLWAEHVQPMLENTGNALAPVLGTIGSLWSNVSVIIADFITILQSAWTEIIEPVFIAICDIVSDVADWFKVLWEEFLGPVIENIGNSIQNMWTKYLKPIIDKVINIVSDVIDIIMVLWHTVLEPVVDFLINTLAPIFKDVFNAIWAAIEWVMNLIFGIIDTLLGVLEGVIDFLHGVFTGDWKEALSGLLNIFVSLGNGIINVMEDTANFVIKIINSLISFVSYGIKGLINDLTGIVEDIAEFLGYDIDLSVTWTTPQIPTVSIPRIPTVALARGGVVTSPTYAMIGEGRYDEAVIPLGNSPQMQDMVKQIADAVNSKDTGISNNKPVEVRVFIGDREWDAFTYESAQRGKDLVGAQPIRIGG